MRAITNLLLAVVGVYIGVALLPGLNTTVATINKIVAYISNYIVNKPANSVKAKTQVMLTQSQTSYIARGSVKRLYTGIPLWDMT